MDSSLEWLLYSVVTLAVLFLCFEMFTIYMSDASLDRSRSPPHHHHHPHHKEEVDDWRAVLENANVSEKRTVLEHLLQNTTREYCTDSSSSSNNHYDTAMDDSGEGENNYEIANSEARVGCNGDGTHDSDNDLETGTEEEGSPVCSICLCPYESGCKVTTATNSVPCKHMFHSDCIMEWLLIENERRQHTMNICCPFCREEMMTP